MMPGVQILDTRFGIKSIMGNSVLAELVYQSQLSVFVSFRHAHILGTAA
jgi:hypothetical protein